MSPAVIRFLSTPSARRATERWVRQLCGEGFLSTPSARRATRHRRGGHLRLRFLSTPSARRATYAYCTYNSTTGIFLSTPSARRATHHPVFPDGSRRISIHALREEGDQAGAFTAVSVRDFYPRPPRGGRPNSEVGMGSVSVFLSTPSARRATRCHPDGYAGQCDFYPRPPRGGRQQKQRQNLYFQTNYTTFCTNLEEP